MTDQDSPEPLPPPTEPTAPPSPGVAPAQSFQGLPLDTFRLRRVPRPLVGVSLWCFGALFWSYLVVGEIVVWTAVPEVLGVLAVMGAFGLAWYRGTSQMPRLPQWRWLLPGIIGICLWLVTLLMSTAMFSTGGRSKAELAALLLWSFAAASYALGRRLTALDRVALSPPARAGRIAFWLIAGIATLLAGVNIISYA
jgi:hypothetical protein